MITTVTRCLLFGVLLSSCAKHAASDSVEETTPTMDNLEVAANFTFNTSSAVTIAISTLDNADKPVPGIRVNLYTDYPDNGGSAIASFVTGSDGQYNGTIKLPTALDSLTIETPTIGFVNVQKRKITAGALTCILGGKNPVNTNPGGRVATMASVLKIEALPPVKAPGTYNSLGVPNYLVSLNDAIDASLLADINAALPENRPVPTYHPQYLNSTAQTNLELQLPAHVWVTFLHEGAGYRNVLGYYKYNLNNPPATAAAIDTIHLIFPNVSFVNSGGGLVSGNKVLLGEFPAGTGIGWVLIANGYNGSTVTSGQGVYYSDKAFNPETNASLKQHCILLNDLNRDKFILSFEDLNRQNGADNDFNDAVFYVTADPIIAVNKNNIVLPAYTSTDTDNDGVTDNFDDYPNDATRAFNNYYPSQNSTGTLAFEDLWPSKGDYDFNDVVVDYNFNPITNSQNQVVQIKAAITVRATGAGYHDGFGIQLPVATSQIASITGADLKSGIISTNANGTEAGQSKATIIVFDDAYNELKWPGGTATGINTTIGAPYVQPKTLNLVINLTTPVSAATLGQPPYNAFIFTNKTRSKEVHLINQAPTDLADRSLLGTQHDNSNTGSGRYYVTSKNLPFALDITAPFDYTIEKSPIIDGHLKFYNWANTGGKQYFDWYKSQTGYRNPAAIFTH